MGIESPFLGQSLTIHIECTEQDCWNHWSGETVTCHLALSQLGECLIDLILVPNSEDNEPSNNDYETFESAGSEDKKEVFITE